jgi:phosphatidylglycerophosphatase A
MMPADAPVRAPLVATLIASGLGSGYAPVAPGTAGSVAALAIAWTLSRYGGWQPWQFAALAAAFTVPAVWAADRYARHVKRSDPGAVVIDEFIGQWVTLGGACVLDWKRWLAAFVLFRAFDIWKPWPARRLEALPGGFGIVADDILAGIYGALVLFLAGCFNL